MDEFLEFIIGPEGIKAAWAFLFFCGFGMSLFKLAMFNKKRKEMKARGIRLKPDVRIWIDDNIIDFILAFMTAFVAFRFFPDMFSFISTKFPDAPQFSDKMLYGFLLGFMFQIIFHYAMSKVTVGKTQDKVQKIMTK